MRRALTFVTVALLAVVWSAFAFADVAKDGTQIINYPLSINTVQDTAKLSHDVVMVHYVGGVTDIKKFMDGWWDIVGGKKVWVEGVVPAAQRTTGALPVPANMATLVTNVTIPMSKRAFVYNQGSLPLWLRVVAKPASDAGEDSHERFCSYFITKYTADARVTKFHVREVSIHRTFD